MVCPRCGRQHSGVCGIPSEHSRTRQETTSNKFSIHTNPKPLRTKLTKHGLEEMLDWGLEQEKKCEEMLKALSVEMEEYNQILERLDKVWTVNEQIKRQLVAKKRG